VRAAALGSASIELESYSIKHKHVHPFHRYTKRVMLIYTGTHYDALAIAKVSLEREGGREHSKAWILLHPQQQTPNSCSLVLCLSMLPCSQNPRAPESDDKTEFNPRTKTGKMAIAAAAKLVELTHNK
jgi:hypothetical protein